MSIRNLTIALALFTTAGLWGQAVVVNGASFRTEQPVAVGSWVSGFATLGGATNATASSAPYPTTLGGVRVLVDGRESPIYYVDPARNQVNFLVPAGVEPGVRPVRIISGGSEVTTSLRVMQTAPGVFVIDQSVTPGRGAILNQNGGINSESNPARRGEVIQIYATGQGALSSPIADGAAAPQSPLVTTVSTPQVYVAGVAATVQFSGMAPNFVGLWQVNVFVPQQNFISGRVPLKIFMDGVDSNEVSFFVAQ
jgi:uncharacterized protein (TIGR03437 family)